MSSYVYHNSAMSASAPDSVVARPRRESSVCMARDPRDTVCRSFGVASLCSFPFLHRRTGPVEVARPSVALYPVPSKGTQHVRTT